MNLKPFPNTPQIQVCFQGIQQQLLPHSSWRYLCTPNSPVQPIAALLACHRQNKMKLEEFPEQFCASTFKQFGSERVQRRHEDNGTLVCTDGHPGHPIHSWSCKATLILLKCFSFWRFYHCFLPLGRSKTQKTTDFGFVLLLVFFFFFLVWSFRWETFTMALLLPSDCAEHDHIFEIQVESVLMAAPLSRPWLLGNTCSVCVLTVMRGRIVKQANLNWKPY